MQMLVYALVALVAGILVAGGWLITRYAPRNDGHKRCNLFDPTITGSCRWKGVCSRYKK